MQPEAFCCGVAFCWRRLHFITVNLLFLRAIQTGWQCYRPRWQCIRCLRHSAISYTLKPKGNFVCYKYWIISSDFTINPPKIVLCQKEIISSRNLNRVYNIGNDLKGNWANYYLKAFMVLRWLWYKLLWDVILSDMF